VAAPPTPPTALRAADAGPTGRAHSPSAFANLSTIDVTEERDLNPGQPACTYWSSGVPSVGGHRVPHRGRGVDVQGGRRRRWG
jgi:hypothetical protein